MEELNLDNEIKSFEIEKAETIQDNKLKLMTVAGYLGYKQMPPTIRQFLEDPYYLKNVSEDLYPFWMEQLEDIFPSPIHTRYPIVVVKGGIGTGKSTFSRICGQYMACRLAYLKDPWKTFGLMKGKSIKFSYFHHSSALAQTDFVEVINTWNEMCPFFKDLVDMGWYDKIETVADGPRSNANIGSDVIFYNLSELNFINYDKAFDKSDQAFKRWDSRFGRFKNYFGMVIIDTSSRGDDSIADDFVRSNPYGDLVKVINTNQWKVREHLNYYGRKGWFKVYCGDSLREPYIVSDFNPLHNGHDPERVIDVPLELKADFEYNIVTALQDKAGISTSSSDKFYKDTTNLVKCFTLPQYGPDVVAFDFFDKTDKLIYRFDRVLSEIPDDKVIYIRYDIGVTGDNAGLAIAYFDKWKVYDDKKSIRQPIIKVPLAVGISRYADQETPISHLFEFVMDLNERFEIGRVTADQFASRQLLQDLQREEIPQALLSVDRTDEAYLFVKNLTLSNLIEFPMNDTLKREYCELVRVGNKVDHPARGSKDIADAVTGAVFDLYKDIKKAGQLSTKYRSRTYSKSVIDRLVKEENQIQDMINNLF